MAHPCGSKARHSASILATVVTLVIASGLAVAGQTAHLKDAPGTWKPWKMTLSSGARASTRATAAELKAFEAHLVAFREILRRAPAVAEPRGYSVEAWGHLVGYDHPADGQRAAHRMPISGGVDFGAFSIYEIMRNGARVRIDTGETPLLLFTVNDLRPQAIGQPGPPEWHVLEHDVVLQPPATGERAGFPRYDDIVAITRRTAPLWTPVPLLEAWQLQLQASKRALASAQDVAEKMKRNLADEIDPAKKAAREAGYRKTAPSTPDPAAFLTQMAQVEAIREKTARAELEPTSGTMTLLRKAEREVAAVEAVITALTPDERAAPACWLKEATRLEGAFRGEPNARCRALVRPNHQFFDPSLPRSAPQLLMIANAKRCHEDLRDPHALATLPGGCAANRALLESWDRQAVLDWLQ
jgi:hypothetical protein